LGLSAACAADHPFGLAFGLASDLRRLLTFGRRHPTQPPTDIGVRSNGQPSCCSPACAFDQPSGPTFRSTCSLRHRPTFQFRLSNDLRPSPPADPPAMPSNEPQLAPSTHLPARPSSQPPACAFDWPSDPAFKPNLRLSSGAAFKNSAFRSISGLRLPSILQLNLPIFLQLSPLIDHPIQPLLQPGAYASGLFSDRTVVPTISLRLWPTLRLSRCANHRLAPLVNSPAVLSVQPPTCADCQPSSSALESNLRLSSIAVLIGAAFRPNLGLASSTDLPVTFSSDHRLSPPFKPSGPTFKPNHRLAARSSVEETLGVACLCMQVQNLRILWIICGQWGMPRKPLHRSIMQRITNWLVDYICGQIGMKA